MDFTEEQIQRYARHIMLPDVGGTGQAALLASRVLVVGAGGLGSPLILYLAAAGVGTLGVADDDRVELGNLQRQVVHDTAGIGRTKVASAAGRVAALNPDVCVVAHHGRLTDDAETHELVSGYDLVADGSDNFATRYLLNRVCFRAQVPLVSAAILGFDGQISTYKAYLGDDHPCYQCLFPVVPPPGQNPSCSEGGVLGALAGMVGSLQAVEVLKELLGIGNGLSGKLILYDALSAVVHTISIAKKPLCQVCGSPSLAVKQPSPSV